MDKNTALHLLITLIDYFEAGNHETDSAAQAIIASDVNFKEKWEAEIKRLVAGNEWTGLRAPEADIIASALHRLQRLLAEGD